MTGFYSKEAEVESVAFNETRAEMLASATLSAKQYLKDQKSEDWQDTLQYSILEDWKTASLILGHLMTGSYAAAHEMLRQHIFSEAQIEKEMRVNESMREENKSDGERLDNA